MEAALHGIVILSELIRWGIVALVFFAAFSLLNRFVPRSWGPSIHIIVGGSLGALVCWFTRA